MAKKLILSSLLVLVLLTASVYLIFNDEVRIDIGKTSSTFQVYENGSWVVSGVEYVNLFDGTAKMRASSRSLDTFIGDDNFTTVTRIANYKDNISTIEIYEFDPSVEEVELFPISHSIQVINGEDKLLQYEVQKLLYSGETISDIESPQSFGHKMKVEWEDGNYYSRIWKYSGKDEGKLTVKYRIDSDNYSKNVRLFDPPAPTGGTITYDGAYTIHTFTSNGYFNFTGVDLDAEVLVVGAGGGGGTLGGGGGAGGMVIDSSHIISADNYSIVVGIGGAKSTSNTNTGSNGGNSSFHNITAIGGGAGSSQSVSNTNAPGGSGGGGQDSSGGVGYLGIAGIQTASGGEIGYGNDGGDGGANAGGGGGGGAGSDGYAYNAGRDGGIGIQSNITGTNTYYAGGGGGGGRFNPYGDGGLGGGGDGGDTNNAIAGTDGLGGGGGGGGVVLPNGAYTDPADGGDGIVIIRYLLPLNFTTIPANDSIVYLDTWDGVTFESSNDDVNYSINDTDNFQINLTGFLNWTNQLSVGNYYINVSINLSSDFVWTIYNLNVTEATLTGSITGTTPIIYKIAGDVEATETNTGDGDVTYKLYRDGIEVSNPDTEILGVGTYDYIYNSTGGANYSSNSSIDTFELVVNKATLTGSISGTEYLENGTAADIEGTETNTGDGDVVYKLYREGIEVSNPDITILDVGDYDYIYNSTGGTNYSSNSSIDTFTLNINISGFWYDGEKVTSLNIELGTEINNITSNITGVTTICVDIDHPDYGINYSCDDNNIDFSLNISYFRKNIFNDSSITKILEFIGTEIKELFFPSHQYDEVDGFSFNISGENYPENVQINNSNVSVIDRYYPGFLIGSNIYQNKTADNVTYKNLTYAYDASQTIYFWMDKNSTLQNMIFNITGSEFGFDDLNEFDNYSDIDTALTTCQLDLTGVIMAKNVSKITSTYDNFGDASINTTLWTATTSSSGTDGTAVQSVTETGGEMVLSTSATSDPTSKSSTAYVDSDILESYESNNISFSIDVAASWEYGTTLQNEYSSGSIYTIMGGTIWSIDMPDVTPAQHGSGDRTATGTLDFNLIKFNTTYWKVITNGEITYVAGDTTRVDTYTNNITYVAISGDLRFYTYVLVPSDGYSGTSLMQVSNVTRELYNRSNSTVISNSVYDASGDIAKATALVLGYNGANDLIYIYLSADNGNNWENVANGVEHSFSNTGRNLKWRIDINTTDTSKTTNHTYISSVNLSIEKGSPMNISFDFGNDGITDWNRSAELNSSNSPVQVEINMSLVNLTSSLSGAAYYGNNLMRVPLKITSTIGQIDVDTINLTYNPNPVYLNQSAISTYLENSVGQVDFPISIESINGNITFDDVKFDYAGGNDTIDVILHNADYSTNYTLNLTYYYSRWDYEWGPDNVDYIWFGPKTPTENNTTPYGQTSTTPILNITNYGYGGKNATLSIMQDDTLGCVNTTISLDNNKSNGWLITDDWLNLTNMSYLDTVDIYLWADYNCDYSTWYLFEPNYYFRQCVDGGICSTELI